jgi:2-methylcitrate dehydratase PrpD
LRGVLKMISIKTNITRFIDNIKYGSFPEIIKKQLKRSILDAIGCTISGINTPIGVSISKLGNEFTQHCGATIIGKATNVSPFIAAMANSFFANALDADDGHRASRLHAGGVIIPTALASGELNDCNGERFLEAVLLGYELGLRAGIVSQKSSTYFGSAYGATFGAAAAAAHVLGLSSDNTFNALGICEMHAPNCQLMGWISARDIPMIKEGMGWSAASGLMAAYLAKNGVTGALTIFDEGREISRIDQIGEIFEIDFLYFKPFPSCRWTHSPLESLLFLLKQHEIRPENVKQVRVRTFSKAACLDKIAPLTAEEAQYSIPFVLGAAILDRDFKPIHHSIHNLNNHKILEQAKKITIIDDPQMNLDYPEFVISKLEIETENGEIFSKENRVLLGDWDRPMTDEQLTEKFYKFTESSISKSNADIIIDKIWNLEQIISLREFIKLLHNTCLKK